MGSQSLVAAGGWRRTASERNRAIVPGIRQTEARFSAGATTHDREVVAMSDFSRGGVLARFFSGLCEYVCEGRLGLADPPVLDYLSDLSLCCGLLCSARRV